jgi:lipoate-protein ligase A
MSETIIYKSNSFDPWYNLAVEELLLDTVGENQYILYLWQNRDTVVIGKNQNPWKECRTRYLEQNGGYLARRLSGGGAVFHDLGNLNFTFLMNRNNYDLGKQAGIILDAVRKLGIPAEMSGRNDLTVAGKKFSGNAFCFRNNNAYHHGTILVASDLERIPKYLQVSEDKIRSKGIESVRSRVVNLKEYAPLLTMDILMDELCREFTKTYGKYPIVFQDTVKNVDSLDRLMIQDLYKKYSSWEWRYGDAPAFDLIMDTRFSWGGIEVGLELKKGVITGATVYSDTLDEEFIELLPPRLKGLRLNASAMADRICNVDFGPARKQMQVDIAQWILSKKF